VWQRFIIVIVFIIVVATFAIAVAMTRAMVISNTSPRLLQRMAYCVLRLIARDVEVSAVLL
jgi:hypothetical protein